MNTPNKLTLLRVVLVPVFMALALVEGTAFQISALVVFILASLTDYFDGKLARKYNMVTTFGKFADPLADKMLTSAAFLVFTCMDLISPWVLMIVLFREFAVSGVRFLAAGTGTVIAASFWGKLKTVSQMIAIILTFVIIILEPGNAGLIIINVSIWISTVLTLLSGADYIFKSKDLLTFK